MRNPIALTGTMLIFVASMAAGQDTTADELRGELLYSTHCIACHTTQAHWRKDRLATDWTSLKFQVRRWQNNIALGWSEDDVTAVARYLNHLFYHFPATDTTKSGEADAARAIAAQRQD
jgi:mono/diheme cytochrome c family protein